MRIRMRLSSESVLAIYELKRDLFGDPHTPVTAGYMIDRAYMLIEPNLTSLKNEDWLALSNKKVKDITGTKEVTGEANTTVNLEKKVFDGITLLQKNLLSTFKGNKRVYRTFVVKLVLLAALNKIHEE